jgi:hypothetical protein
MIKDDTNKLACASYLIFGDLKFDIKYDNKFYIGEDIYTINSNLAVISSTRFSRTYAKGVISNIMNDDIVLIDVGLLPNSHGSIVYKSNGNIFAILLPILNIKHLYVPLGFGLKIETLVNIFSTINSDKTGTSKYIPYISFLENTVFIVYRYSI